MKEAFELIKERLEESSMVTFYFDGKPPKQCVPIEDALSIISEVEAEYMKNPVHHYAMAYAKSLVQFGVDVRERLDSAVAQSAALNQAYIRGIEDERKRIYEAEYGNPKTNADRIRAMSDEELAKFLADIKIEDIQGKCADFKGGCWYDCKTKHSCERGLETLYLKWLKSEREPYKEEGGENE